VKRRLALALLCTTVQTHAADWEYVTSTAMSTVYVDPASVSPLTEKRTSAWFLFDHVDTRYDIDSARVFKSSLHWIGVDCTTKQLHWKRLEKHAGPLATGPKISARNVDNATANFMESVAEQAREAIADSLCAAAR